MLLSNAKLLLPQLILPFVAYLCGSISFATYFAKKRGIDIRLLGSGNPGATNVARVVGKKEGRYVMILDVLKGLVPVGLARLLVPEVASWTLLAAVVGHCFPIFHRFRGGKGVATFSGGLLPILPLAALSLVLARKVVRKRSSKASVASLAGVSAATFVGAIEFSFFRTTHGYWGWLAPVVAAAVLIWAKHIENLQRLARGEELDSE